MQLLSGRAGGRWGRGVLTQDARRTAASFLFKIKIRPHADAGADLKFLKLARVGDYDAPEL